MKSNWHFSALLLLLLFGCVNGEQTYKVDYTNLLCGGNSKVWELDLTKAAENERPKLFKWGQGVFVFYFSGKVEIGSLQDFATMTSDTGSKPFKEWASANTCIWYPSENQRKSRNFHRRPNRIGQSHI